MTRIDGIDLTEPGAGRLLPPTAFTSPAVFAAEMERSFDLGGELAALRDFRREAFDRTNQQDIGVVSRVQRGLRAHGLPPGVHSAFLEARIGHFERLVVRALEDGPGAARRPLARPGSLTPNGGAA